MLNEWLEESAQRARKSGKNAKRQRPLVSSLRREEGVNPEG
jgi:hypothetical protein